LEVRRDHRVYRYRVACDWPECRFTFNCVTRADALWVIKEHLKLTGHYRRVNYVRQTVYEHRPS